MTTNGQTLDLLDRTGKQAFGDRLHLLNFERVQEMAWTIAECYDIEFNACEYNQGHQQDYFQATIAQKLNAAAH